VSKHTLYAWKAKYGGMDVSEAQELRQLREENARLKRMVADLSLDKDMLQSVIRKKLLGLVVRRAEVQRLVEEFSASQRHACELLEIPRSSCRYVSRRDDTELRERLMELARAKPRFGYRRLSILLQREGRRVNHKRVQRVYRAAGLQVKRIRRNDWRGASPRHSQQQPRTRSGRSTSPAIELGVGNGCAS
jgi:putative transposase